MYGSVEGVKARLRKLAKRIKPDDAPDFDPVLDIKHSIIEEMLSSESEKVDAALSSRYTFPLIPAPAVINDVVNDLTAWKVATIYETTISAEENQNLLAMRKDAKEVLAGLASGSSILPPDKYPQKGTGASVSQQLDRLLIGDVNEKRPLFDLEDEATWQGKV